MMIVSQFTLCADCRKGNRPSFTGAESSNRIDGIVRIKDEKYIIVDKGKNEYKIPNNQKFNPDLKNKQLKEGIRVSFKPYIYPDNKMAVNECRIEEEQ